MGCKNCRARSQMLQDSVLEMKLASAMGHVVKGAAEMVGLKEKTGAAELDAKQGDPAGPIQEFIEDWPRSGLDTSEDGRENEQDGQS